MRKWKKLKPKNPAGKGAGELTRQKKIIRERSIVGFFYLYKLVFFEICKLEATSPLPPQLSIRNKIKKTSICL